MRRPDPGTWRSFWGMLLGQRLRSSHSSGAVDLDLERRATLIDPCVVSPLEIRKPPRLLKLKGF